MIRRLLKSKKNRRKEVNYPEVKTIYDRGSMSFPVDYLIVHQPSDPERVAKVKAQAAELLQKRNKKRLNQWLNHN